MKKEYFKTYTFDLPKSVEVKGYYKNKMEALKEANACVRFQVRTTGLLRYSKGRLTSVVEMRPWVAK